MNTSTVRQLKQVCHAKNSVESNETVSTKQQKEHSKAVVTKVITVAAKLVKHMTFISLASDVKAGSCHITAVLSIVATLPEVLRSKLYRCLRSELTIILMSVFLLTPQIKARRGQKVNNCLA